LFLLFFYLVTRSGVHSFVGYEKKEEQIRQFWRRYDTRSAFDIRNRSKKSK